MVGETESQRAYKAEMKSPSPIKRPPFKDVKVGMVFKVIDHHFKTVNYARVTKTKVPPSENLFYAVFVKPTDFSKVRLSDDIEMAIWDFVYSGESGATTYTLVKFPQKSASRGKNMVKAKKERDWFAEFKGKQKLTEQEVNLMKKRLNDGKVDVHRMREGGYALTPDQVAKGKAWLMDKWRTTRGVERKNCPFGYREMAALETFKTIRLIDWYDMSRYGRQPFYVPVYEVVGKDGYFQYYVGGGEPQIIG